MAEPVQVAGVTRTPCIQCNRSTLSLNPTKAVYNMKRLPTHEEDTNKTKRLESL